MIYIYIHSVKKQVQLHFSCTAVSSEDSSDESSEALYIYVTGKLCNQAFREMPKNFSHFLK